MPDSDSVRYGRSVASLQQNLQASVSKNHSLTDALRSIRARASDCERINLAGKSPAAKTAATLRNIISICDEALETKQ